MSKKREMVPQYFSMREYEDAGCMKFDVPFLIVKALYLYTNGVMCKGCPKFQGGSCKSFRKMLAANSPQPQQAEYIEPVRAEAARRGISIKQVRRERRQKEATS